MSKITTIGKFLDQPILVGKFQKAIPAILSAGAIGYTINEVRKENKGEKKKKGINTGITMGVTVASALAAPYIASFITKRKLPDSLNNIKIKNKEIIENYIKAAKPEGKTKEILERSKEKILKYKEVKELYNKLGNDKEGKEFLEQLIPSPKNIKAKEIFSEIGYLSIYGAIPVIGGITGGIIADKSVDNEKWKERIPNKVNEGIYQYLANIFMCNIGAGVALGILEKCNIRSRSARAIGMTTGIILTGVIGGSKIANIFSSKIVEPICRGIFKKDYKKGNYKSNIYTDILDIDFVNNKKKISYINVPKEIKKEEKCKERKPEALDICLHTDDIATVSLLSGLKWIEPALPIMYSISGYRAGKGYRN